MYTLLLLLLFTPSVAAEAAPVGLCQEVAAEVLIAIEEGRINKQAGLDLIHRCWTREAAD